MFHVQVSDGTGWQTVSTHATVGEAADVALWYEQRKLKARVVGIKREDDRRLDVALDRMISAAGGAR